MKYHDESTKVSIVSVSRREGSPQVGQSTSRKEGDVSKGFPVPVNATSRGRTTGRSASGTGTTPHEGQWMMGIGVPQYRCRETSQGRIFQLSVLSPASASSKAVITACLAASPSSPSKPGRGELIIGPMSSCALVMGASSALPSAMTRRTGRPHVVANSKSR